MVGGVAVWKEKEKEEEKEKEKEKKKEKEEKGWSNGECCKESKAAAWWSCRRQAERETSMSGSAAAEAKSDLVLFTSNALWST